MSVRVAFEGINACRFRWTAQRNPYSYPTIVDTSPPDLENLYLSAFVSITHSAGWVMCVERQRKQDLIWEWTVFTRRFEGKTLLISKDIEYRAGNIIHSCCLNEEPTS
jgi:hypothetical protein